MFFYILPKVQPCLLPKTRPTSTHSGGIRALLPACLTHVSRAKPSIHISEQAEVRFSPVCPSLESLSTLVLGGRDTSFHAPVIDSRKSCQRQLGWWLTALVNDCRVLGLRRCRLDIHKEAAEASCLHRDTTQHLPGVPSSCQQHCAVLSGHKRKLFTTNAHSSSREKT